MSDDNTEQSKRSFFGRQRENSNISIGKSIKHFYHNVSGKKNQVKTMTFEEKTKTFVIDDREQWLRFRRELNERGILTSNGVQEYLIIFVHGIEKERSFTESQNSPPESETQPSSQNGNSSNTIPKRLRDLRSSARNGLKRVYSSTFNFAPKQDKEDDSVCSGFKSLVKKEWTSKFQTSKIPKFISIDDDDDDFGNTTRDAFPLKPNNILKAISERFEYPNPLKVTRIKNIYSHTFGSHNKTRSNTTEPVYIRRRTVFIDQDTLKIQLLDKIDDDDEDDDEIVLSQLHDNGPIEAREIYTFGQLHVDDYYNNSFKMLPDASINVPHAA